MKDLRRRGDPWHLRLIWHPLAVPALMGTILVVGLLVTVAVHLLGVYVWWLA